MFKRLSAQVGVQGLITLIFIALLIRWTGLAEACVWVEWLSVDTYDPQCFVLSYYTCIIFSSSSKLWKTFKFNTDVILLNKQLNVVFRLQPTRLYSAAWDCMPLIMSQSIHK